VLLPGAFLALFVQLVAIVGLGTGWAGSLDVMQGGCGWDGTCSDAGAVDVTVYGLLVLILIDVVASVLLAKRAVRRRAAAARAGSAPAVSTGLLWANGVELAIIIVGAVSLAIFLQTEVIGYVADQRYPGITGWQPAAGFVFKWSTTIPAAELVAVVVGLLSLTFWRGRQSAA
jgi:hypothetical protein